MSKYDIYRRTDKGLTMFATCYYSEVAIRWGRWLLDSVRKSERDNLYITVRGDKRTEYRLDDYVNGTVTDLQAIPVSFKKSVVSEVCTTRKKLNLGCHNCIYYKTENCPEEVENG